MAKYLCTNCNYRFDSTNPSECPYCSHNSIEPEKSAEELLDEVTKLLRN